MSTLAPSIQDHRTLTLEQLQIGQHAIVRSVEGPPEIRNRLLEMGMTPGATVRLTRVAPFGDPMELQVRGYRLSLRRAEASAVLVEFE